MKSSNNQYPLSSVSKQFNLQLVLRFLPSLLLLAFGATIGITIGFYLRSIGLQLNHFSHLSSLPSSSHHAPPPIKNPEESLVSNSNSNLNQNVVHDTKEFIDHQHHPSNVVHHNTREFFHPSNVGHDMSDEELLWRASMSPMIREYPFDRVPKVAFMFLVRGPVPLATFWESFFKGHEGYYSIYVHSNPSYDGLSDPGSSVFHGRRIPSKVVEWGKFNMIEAERRLLANALLDFSNQRFVLISESCIPLFNFTTIYSYLINSTQSYVMAYDTDSPVARGRYSIHMFPAITLQQWRKGSQWFEIDRPLALQVVSDQTYFPVFREFCIRACYADEHYLPTFVTIRFPERNSNRSLTWVDWSKGGLHPTKYVRPEVTVAFLENLRNQRCEYNGVPQSNACFLFARKFLPTSLTRLMRFAPTVLHIH